VFCIFEHQLASLSLALRAVIRFAVIYASHVIRFAVILLRCHLLSFALRVSGVLPFISVSSLHYVQAKISFALLQFCLVG
jgi:hypothetical protein